MNGEALVKKTTKIMFGDAGISGTAQYMSQLVWVLFLKVFDYKEEEWELEGDYVPVIPAPFRFRDWADPRRADGTKDYSNRITGDKLIDFVNNTLFPYLRGIEVDYKGEKRLFASEGSKAAIVRSFMAESQNYMKDGVRLRQLINEIGDIDFDVASEKHDFNDFYERLLKELQNGGKATGEFYTPRAITRFIVDHIDPKIGENVADFACGTGGFLADSITHLQRQARSVEDLQKIQESIYGIEWKQLPYMLCVTNMYLHNIDDPHIVHGDGLAKDVLDLSDNDLFSCIVMNPPFGGEFNKADLKNFPDDVSSSESADLFVARIIYCLKKNGRCGLVLPDGLLFGDDQSKVNLKRCLMTECNLHTVIRLPSSVFAPYTPICTNLLFFEKTGRTKEVWFYRMDMPEGRKHFNKTHPITREDMRIIDEWWSDRHEIKDEKDDPSMKETWKSRKYSFEQIESMGFNLNLCGYPEDEEIVLTPEETIANYMERRESLEGRLDKGISVLRQVLDGANGRIIDLGDLDIIERQLADLHSLFMRDMRKSILQYAMQGKLVEQRPEEGTGRELYQQIQAERIALVKAGKLKKQKPLPEIEDEDVPFDIPDNWVWVKLGNLTSKIGAGSTPLGGARAGVYTSSGVPFIREMNVYDDGIHREGMVFISQKLSDTRANSKFYPGDLLLNITGGSIGRCAVVPPEMSIGDVNQHVEIIRLIDKSIKDYIHVLMCSPYVQSIIASRSVGDKAGFSATKCKNIEVPLPPLAEQKRIIERLGLLLPYIKQQRETC